MRDNREKINRILAAAAGVWFISLLGFVWLFAKIERPGIACPLIYGVWNLLIFAAAFGMICRIVNRTMRQVDDCIQSLIDGHPRQAFSMEEESLLGKFQMQIMKLYRIMESGKAAEEKTRRDLSGMVADLVHQVNTPLTNIQMYSGFLVQDGISGEDRRQICEVIDAQVEKLGWFAEGFAKTARLEDDIMQMSPQPQPILDMVLDAIDQISLKAQSRGIEIILNGRQDIRGVYDRRWTGEALFNLLDNAVKYGREKAPVTVEMTPYNLFVRIDVINYGEQIPREEYNRIFTRFYRGKNAAMIREGVGLGLYLARKIVSEQGGYVKVGAHRNRGNVFSIFLLKA